MGRWGRCSSPSIPWPPLPSAAPSAAWWSWCPPVPASLPPQPASPCTSVAGVGANPPPEVPRLWHCWPLWALPPQPLPGFLSLHPAVLLAPAVVGGLRDIQGSTKVGDGFLALCKHLRATSGPCEPDGPSCQQCVVLARAGMAQGGCAGAGGARRRSWHRPPGWGGDPARGLPRCW